MIPHKKKPESPSIEVLSGYRQNNLQASTFKNNERTLAIQVLP